LLTQVPDDVHVAADRRRRLEGITWARLLTRLLSRWATGEPLEAAVRRQVAAAVPPPPRCRRGPPGEQVVIPADQWFPSLRALMRATKGKAVADQRITALGHDDEDDDEVVE
jgi:hypothetical protein